MGNNPLNMVDPTGQTGVGVWVARGIMTGIAADVVVPEPTDAVPWKWAAYGVLTGVACIAACDEAWDVISSMANGGDGAVPGLPGSAPDGGTISPAPPGSRGLPGTGEPGSWVVGPRGDRKYGEDGLPERDVDWAHDHGQGRPHVHDWDRDADGNPNRGEGRPATDDEKFSEPVRDPDTGRIDRDD